MFNRFFAVLAVAATVALASPANAQVWGGGEPLPWYDGLYTSGITGLALSLVGRDLNGTDLNGESLEGRSLAFVETAGAVDRRGDAFDEVNVTGSALNGFTNMGRFLGPKKMKRAIFMGRLADGGVLPLKINKVKRHRAEHHRDVLLYTVSYQTERGWKPLCGRDDNGRKVAAVALKGRWDMTQGTESGGAHFADDDVFTFACDGGVLAHCVMAGYKPWRHARQCDGETCRTVSLADHHQACTRMLRGDYCGDGTTHTEDGVEVNHYDGFNLRSDSEDWTFEAEWTPNGARCMNEERLPGYTPACAADLVRDDCGAPNNLVDQALIFSEHPPRD